MLYASPLPLPPPSMDIRAYGHFQLPWPEHLPTQLLCGSRSVVLISTSCLSLSVCQYSMLSTGLAYRHFDRLPAYGLVHVTTLKL